MGRIDEEHMAFSRLSRVQTGLQFRVKEIGLDRDMLGQVFLGGTGMARTNRHFSPRSLRNLRT